MSAQELMEEFSLLPEEAQRRVTDFVAFLRQRYVKDESPLDQPVTELTEESFVGMWSQRKDLADSSEWMRHIRRGKMGGE